MTPRADVGVGTSDMKDVSATRAAQFVARCALRQGAWGNSCAPRSTAFAVMFSPSVLFSSPFLKFNTIFSPSREHGRVRKWK